MNDTRYADVFIYVPSANQILRIEEGGGTNLLKEDEEAGYVDYIYYDQYELDSQMTNSDGGMITLTELFRDKFRSTAEAIPAALDMAYGCADLKYVILEKNGIACKV